MDATPPSEFERFREFGMAHVLVGMRYAHEILGRAIEEMALRLAAEQGKPAQPQAKLSRRPKEPAKNKIASAARGYWANLTPEQRSAEVIRRRKVAAKKRAPKVRMEPAA